METLTNRSRSGLGKSSCSSTIGTRICSAICLPVSLTLFSSPLGDVECELAMNVDEFGGSACCGWFSSVSLFKY